MLINSFHSNTYIAVARQVAQGLIGHVDGVNTDVYATSIVASYSNVLVNAEFEGLASKLMNVSRYAREREQPHVAYRAMYL